MARTVRGVLGATMVAVLAAVAGSGPAAAHTDLQASTPASGQVLDRAPSEVTLAFTEEMDPTLGAVVLHVGGKKVGRLELSTGARETELVAAVDAGELPDAGVAPWRIDYRVTSRDGHPVTGSVAFQAPTPASPVDRNQEPEPRSPTLPPTSSTEAGGGATGPEAEQSEAQEEAGEDREGGSLVNVLVVAGIVLLVVALALVSLQARGRDEELALDEPGDHEQPEPRP